MKILFVTDLYKIKEDSTIPDAIENFALALKEKGKDIFVLRPNFLVNSKKRKRKIFPQGIYHRNGIKIYNRNIQIPFYFLNSNCSYLEEKYDLIISHMPMGHIFAYFINKKLKLKRISIVHISDYHVFNRIFYCLYFKKNLMTSLQKSDLVGARNKFLKEYFRADFILPSFIEKKYIIERKKLNDDFIQGKKIKLVTLSQLIKRKNLDKVILALNEIKKQNNFDFIYDIYGKGEQNEQLNKLIKNLNLEKNIRILPYINHNLIYETLDNYDVFILPSVYETFGIAYLEAMARGLITIGTYNTGIDGIIKDSQNGFLVRGDEEKITKEIYQTLLKIQKLSKEQKEKITQNTYKTIQNYEKEKIMNKYVEIIKKIL